MVAARGALGQSRQLFWVQQGGVYFQDNLLTDQANLLKQVADAMAASQAAMGALGTKGSVTTFTTSEFGRALQGNGRGSDHGWGSHHLVVGGAVLGNRVYGRFPTVAIGGPEDSSQGRLIPTTRSTNTAPRWRAGSACPSRSCRRCCQTRRALRAATWAFRPSHGAAGKRPNSRARCSRRRCAAGPPKLHVER